MAVRSELSNQILPAVSFSRHATHNARVLLPEPDWPIKAVVVLACMLSETPSKAAMDGWDGRLEVLRYIFCALSTRIRGGVPRSAGCIQPPYLKHATA